MAKYTKHYTRSGFFDAGGAPVAIARSCHQKDHAQHTHDFNELVIVTGGQSVHLTPWDRYTIKRGDVFIIEHAGRHGYESTSDLEIVNVLFDFERLSLPLQDLHGLPGVHALFTVEPSRRKQQGYSGPMHLDDNDLETALGWVDEIESELIRHEPGYRFVTMALFLRLVAFLGRAFGKSQSPYTQEILRLGEVLSWLQQHFNEDIRVEDLARRAGLSSRQFHRLFKAATGHSPLQYVLHLRIDRAKVLLRETPDTLTEIALCLGFNDSNYFSRQFRRQTGMTPRVFRTG